MSPRDSWGGQVQENAWWVNVLQFYKCVQTNYMLGPAVATMSKVARAQINIKVLSAMIGAGTSCYGVWRRGAWLRSDWLCWGKAGNIILNSLKKYHQEVSFSWRRQKGQTGGENSKSKWPKAECHDVSGNTEVKRRRQSVTPHLPVGDPTRQIRFSLACGDRIKEWQSS